jgi:hypothetical protein
VNARVISRTVRRCLGKKKVTSTSRTYRKVRKEEEKRTPFLSRIPPSSTNPDSISTKRERKKEAQISRNLEFSNTSNPYTICINLRQYALGQSSQRTCTWSELAGNSRT